MRVVVPALTEYCPAALALRAEGLEPMVTLLEHDDDYARMLQRLWREEQTFILVEHDVVPWPGALERLWDCEEMCCAYQYPLGSGGELGTGLGCLKLSTEFLRNRPYIATILTDSPWYRLDTLILPKVQAHLHAPPVGHVRDPRESRCSHTECHRLDAPLWPTAVSCYRMHIETDELARHKLRKSDRPLALHHDFAGFRIWYSDGQVLSNADGAWNELPAVGVACATFYERRTYPIYYPEPGEWRTEHYVQQFYGHSNNYFWLDQSGRPAAGPSSSVPHGLTAGAIKVGTWMLDQEYADLVAEAQTVRTAP